MWSRALADCQLHTDRKNQLTTQNAQQRPGNSLKTTSQQPQRLSVFVVHSFTGLCEWIAWPCGQSPAWPLSFQIMTIGTGRKSPACCHRECEDWGGNGCNMKHVPKGELHQQLCCKTHTLMQVPTWQLPKRQSIARHPHTYDGRLYFPNKYNNKK